MSVRIKLIVVKDKNDLSLFLSLFFTFAFNINLKARKSYDKVLFLSHIKTPHQI